MKKCPECHRRHITYRTGNISNPDFEHDKGIYYMKRRFCTNVLCGWDERKYEFVGREDHD